MEQINTTYQLMEMISKPVFCVKQAIIVYANQAAKSMQIQAGTPIEKMLADNMDSYTDFNGGCLFLTVRIAGIECNASVTRGGEYDFFTLDDPTAKDQLRAMSLAGQHLRIPLAGLVATIDTMLSEKAYGSFRHYGDQIRRGIHRIHRIINNMSDVALLDGHTPTTEVLDFGSIIAESVEKSNALLADSGLTITYKDLDRRIYTKANRNLLERAVYNMLSNAIKFSDPGQPITAELSLRNDRLILSIRNSCSSVRPEMLSTAFTTYQRKAAVEDSRIGIGLGMPLIRAAAQAHGGTVLIDQPEPNLVRVTLTIAVCPADDLPTLRNPTLRHLDYAGGRDHALLELSDVLPANVYKNESH